MINKKLRHGDCVVALSDVHIPMLGNRSFRSGDQGVAEFDLDGRVTVNGADIFRPHKWDKGNHDLVGYDLTDFFKVITVVEMSVSEAAKRMGITNLKIIAEKE